MKKIIASLVLFSVLISSLFSKPKFGLVLSGGGARGISHVAILKELDRRGIVPDMIVGTSMGALVGAFYASGWSGKDIERLLEDTDLMSIIIRLDNEAENIYVEGEPNAVNTNLIVTGFGKKGLGTSNGILNDQALSGFIRKNLAKVLDVDDFDKLSIPFRAIGTDVVNAKEIVFSSGSLYKAMRSSMSLPLIFSPVKLSDNVYVMDGGMVNNLPVNIAKEMGADIVLAVDVNDAKNKNGHENEDYDTLSGAFSAFSSVITLVNSIPNYELADCVIVPNVNEFSTIAFDRSAEILKRGEEAVDENKEFFDYLERKLKQSERPLSYDDIEPEYIKAIENDVVSGYSERFNEFIGKPINEETISELENFLNVIRSAERIKRIDYEIEDGVIKLEAEYYKSMEGVVGLGAKGSFGLRYDGFNKPFFFIDPAMSATVQYRLTPRSLFSFSVIYNDSLKLLSRYSTPLVKAKGQYFIGLDFSLGNLTMLSIKDVYDHISKEDIALSFTTGFYYNRLNSFRIDSFLGLDYIHPARFKNPDDGTVLIDYMNLLYPYWDTSISYSNRDWKETLANGFELSAGLKLGADIDLSAKKTSFGYESRLSFYGEVGSEDVKSISTVILSTKRRNSMLKESYTTSKTGTLTHDYIYLSEGARVKLLNDKFYLDSSLFAEFKEKHKGSAADYYSTQPSLAPFSTLSTFSLGSVVSVGYNTSIGHLFASAYISYGERFSLTIEAGIR